MSASEKDVATPDGSERSLRLCLDVNVFVADFLSRRNGGSLGASSKIVQMIGECECALGPVQLVVSWRMLTTLNIILERDFQLSQVQSEAVCQAFAAMAEVGPQKRSPSLVLGGTGLLPMTDREDGTVADAALAGKADLFLTHDIDDFEQGSKSRLATRRIQTGKRGNAKAIMLSERLWPDLLIATPQAAIGWLLGQTAAPVDLFEYRQQTVSVKPPGIP